MSAAVVYLGGRFLEPGEAPGVSLFDRGLLLGDSVFASLRAFGGRPFGVDRHAARLVEAAAAVGIACPPAPELAALAREACARLGPVDAYVRLTLSRGEGGPGLGLEGVGAPTLSVVARPLAAAPFPEEGTPAARVSLRAVPPECMHPAWKVGSYAARVAMRREVEARGQREGLVLSLGGEVVSGVASNLFFALDGALWTPPLSSGCRPGVTRETLLGLFAEAGAPARERALRPVELAQVEAAFFASSLVPVLPVSSLEGHALDPAARPVARARGLYLDAVRGGRE